MTKTWGPLGWATLHSVAALYPDNPSELEKALMARWIESFRMCIVCEKCKSHFTTLLAEYKAMYPNWNASRKDVSLFVIRAHNTVNLRQTNRPVLSASEAIEHLRKNVPTEKAHLIRQSYIVHIRAEWGKLMGVDAVAAARYLRELTMTEIEYWGIRSFNWSDVESLVRDEDVSPLPSRQKESSSIFSFRTPQPRNPVSFTGPVSKPRFSFLSR